MYSTNGTFDRQGHCQEGEIGHGGTGTVGTDIYLPCLRGASEKHGSSEARSVCQGEGN